MAKIIPFHGVRYNSDKVAIDDVATKPYDKISPQEQDAYYGKNPYNCVRLILGKQNDSDSDTDNRYTRAASLLKQWLDEQVLIRESVPAVYIYDQKFQAPGYPSMTRRALVALGKLEPYSSKVVFPHEKTLTGPKIDRLNLLRATKCQFGHIFLLYKDENNSINNAVQSAAEKQEPLYSFTDSLGVTHSLWSVTDQDSLNEVATFFSDKQLLIADGHHRYETALNYSQEMQEKEPHNESYKYQLMSLVNIYDPGLLILPTHRAVKQSAPDIPESWDTALSEYFDITTVPAGKFEIDAISQPDTVKIGMYRGDDAVSVLTLKSKDAVADLMTPGKPAAWYDLPVTVLHDVILEHMMGIDKDKLAAQTHISYAGSLEQGYEMVNDRSHSAVFFVPPTPIESVCDISFSGETMPQKSTDFFPKIYTGLVFNKLD